MSPAAAVIPASDIYLYDVSLITVIVAGFTCKSQVTSPGLIHLVIISH